VPQRVYAFRHKVTPGEPAKTEPGVSPRKSPELGAVFAPEDGEKLTIPPKHGLADTLPGRGNDGTARFGDEKSIPVAKLPICGDASRGGRHSMSLSTDV